MCESGLIERLAKPCPKGSVGSNPTASARFIHREIGLPGGLAERPNARVLKTRGRNPFTGSNPVPTAHLAIVKPLTFFTPFIFKIFPASFNVEPVVVTSSKRIMLL